MEESLYCPVCDACGEEGCCSPLRCKQSPDGDYCNSYLRDLQFGYSMYTQLYDFIPKDKLEEVYDKTYERFYGK